MPYCKKDRIVEFMIYGAIIYEFYSEIQSDPQAKLTKQNATLKDSKVFHETSLWHTN
jgi:hypothetical protein